MAPPIRCALPSSSDESVPRKKLTLLANLAEEGTPKKLEFKLLASTSTRSPSKRPAPPIESTSKQQDRKKLKVAERYWSRDDEIAILQGIIELKQKNGVTPSFNGDSFFEFMKTRLQSLDFDKQQLKYKVWRLRSKYNENVKKGRCNDLKIFQLSKKLWGDIGRLQPDGTTKSRRKSRSLGLLKEELMPPLKDGEPAFDMVKSAKRSELEERWKDMRRAELELFMKRTELIQDQLKVIQEEVKLKLESLNR